MKLRKRVKVIEKYLRWQKLFFGIKTYYNISGSKYGSDTYITKRITIHDFNCTPNRSFVLCVDDIILPKGLTNNEYKYLINIMEDLND